MGIPHNAQLTNGLGWILHLRTPIWVLVQETGEVAFLNQAARAIFYQETERERNLDKPNIGTRSAAFKATDLKGSGFKGTDLKGIDLDAIPRVLPVAQDGFELSIGPRRFMASTSVVKENGNSYLVIELNEETLHAPSGIPVVKSIRRLLSSFSEPLAIADETASLVWANQSFEEALGKFGESSGSEINLVGRPLHELLHKVRVQDLEESMVSLVPFRTRVMLPSGRTFQLTVSPSTGNSTRKRFFVVAMGDVSSEVRAEQERAIAQHELTRSEARFARLAQNVPGVLFELVFHPLRQYAFSWVASTSKKILGIESDALTQSIYALLEIIHPDDLSDIKKSLEHSRAAEEEFAWHGRILSVDKGEIRFVHLKGCPEKADEEGCIRWDGIIMDVTEQKELQLLVESSERMASVGGLAAGVAHEINNPLAYILSNLQVVLEELDNNHGQASKSGMRALDEARTGALRVREIVRDLKRLSRPEQTEVGPVRLEAVIESTVSMAMTEIRHRARLDIELPNNLPDALVNESRIGQVFLNLLINAAQAIEEGHVNDNCIHVKAGVADDDFLFVDIEDSGRGIPESIVPRVFDPFFTTKKVGVGTGLGLSICHNIVREHGGQITIFSEIGKGTRFRVLLPIAPHDVFTFNLNEGGLTPLAEVMPPQPNASALSSSSAIPKPSRRARILLIDDEPALVRALKRQLREYDVCCAQGGIEALERIREEDSFDVVLCDLMMPDCTGMDLYDQVFIETPELVQRFIFMTGGVFTDRARDFLDSVNAPVLEKPFDAHVIRETVSRVAAEQDDRRKNGLTAAQ
ncbi:MAG: response regulator [Deltaproteobacteria bacterium]|nr:response regulator [Deltaproteobacteria bacterium]